MYILGDDVDSIVVNGATFRGDDMVAALSELTDEERDRVVVNFKSGMQTSLAKLDESSGDDTIKVRAGGKVLF